MPFTLVQAGTSLQIINTSGALTTLTFPLGAGSLPIFTLTTGLTPRFSIFNRYVVLVNTPNRPLTVDGDGTVRPLSLIPPRSTLTLSGVAGGTLSGTFQVKQTFILRDLAGNIIAESDYGPTSAAVTISGQYLKVTGIDISEDLITETQLYRTTTGGTTFFPWISIPVTSAVFPLTNQTTIQDDLSDAGLGLLAAPVLGTAPQDLGLVCEWRGRLWGSPRSKPDYLNYTEAGLMYSWPAANALVVPRLGADSRGVTALAARREALGVGRINSIHQVTGTSNTDFRVVKLSENVGVESQESVQVYRDTAYFLWKDGVYEWDTGGIRSITDGQVRSWFTTDSYFNRSRFKNSFAMIDPLRNRYKLFLATPGNSTENRWIEYDIGEKTWWGPHKCDVTSWTPTSAAVITTVNETLSPMIGTSNGFLWQEQTTAKDDVSTGIAMSLDTGFIGSETPDIEKYFGELSVIGKVQSAGSIVITPKVGYIDATAGPTITYDMTTGRQRLDRLGVGKMVQLNLSHSGQNEPVEIYGIEIPWFEVGRR